MSEQNSAKLVQQFIDAVNARDGAKIAGLVTDDVAHDHDGNRDIGADALRAYFAQRASANGDELADVAIMTDQSGGRAAAEFTRRGRAAGGASYSDAAGWFIEIDDGRISRITEYSAR